MRLVFIYSLKCIKKVSGKGEVHNILQKQNTHDKGQASVQIGLLISRADCSLNMLRNDLQVQPHEVLRDDLIIQNIDVSGYFSSLVLFIFTTLGNYANNNVN